MYFPAAVATAVLGSIITFAFGIWTESLTVLMVLMGIDYVTGVAAAIRSSSGLSSETGFWGLAKKGLILLVIMLAHRMDILLGTNFVMGGAVSFYLVNELLSVVENYGKLGLPLPESLRNLVRDLRNPPRTGQDNKPLD